MTPGSNVYRDRADPGTDPDAVRSVDGGEWLLDTELARSIGFSCQFTQEERDLVIGEDDKFLDELLDRGITIVPTKEPTMIYRMGGFSNNFDNDEEISW